MKKVMLLVLVRKDYKTYDHDGIAHCHSPTEINRGRGDGNGTSWNEDPRCN